MQYLLGKLKFGPGHIGDLEEIMKIERAAFSFPWTEGMVLSELFDNPFSYSTVARAGENHQMLGYVFMREILEELHLLSVAVHPAWRRKGLGFQLIQQVLCTCKEKGMERVILEVRASNRPAQALYQKFGFYPVGVRRHYYHKPTEDALLFQYDMPLGSAKRGKAPLDCFETARALIYEHSVNI